MDNGRIREPFNTPFSQIYKYGCLETTNVTVYIEMHDRMVTYRDQINSLFKHLKTPCSNLFVYFQNQRKVVQWNEDLHHMRFQSEDRRNSNDDENHFFNEGLEFITELQYHNFTSKQTLVYFLDYKIVTGLHNLLESLGKLENKSNWNVIIVCHSRLCPTNDLMIPINRIVPIEVYNPNSISFLPNHLKGLIDNPDFDRLEYLKHIKLPEKKLKCLNNKTIRIEIYTGFTFPILENMILLLSNTDSTTKIVFHLSENSNYYWHIIKEHKLNNQRLLFEKTNHFDFFIKNIIYPYDIFVVIDNTPVIDILKIFVKNLKKDVFGNLHSGQRWLIYSYDQKNENLYTNKKTVLKKRDIDKYWLEDVVNVACDIVRNIHV